MPVTSRVAITALLLIFTSALTGSRAETTRPDVSWLASPDGAARAGAIVPAGNTIRVVDSGGDVGRYTSIAVGADGLPIIAYYDATNADLKIAHCDDATCATAALRTVDSAGDVGADTSI